MATGTFATTINCMDGRTQLPVIDFLRRRFGVDFVDSITEPGPNGILAKCEDRAAVESIKQRVDISTTQHGSRQIAIVAHHACAGNPTDSETQISQLLTATKTVRSWGFRGEIVRLWIDEAWQVHEVVNDEDEASS